MKKLKMDNPTDWGKFLGTLIIISLLAGLGVAGLEKAFGLVIVFIGAVTIIVIAGIYIIIMALLKDCIRKQDEKILTQINNDWIRLKKKELTENIRKNDS
jgi:predicted lipid-binding transport protein (Tim44 family)|tara:strand:+ start:385 stop:684 length:300 start_codon:yes stop_codon:yes gene_type:complete